MKHLITIAMILLLTACQAGRTVIHIPRNFVYYIENKGSDTMVNLALAWAEAYQALHPEVSLSVTGGGSGTGIAALINNTVGIANASAQIKQEEIDEAKANGITPVEFTVARDAIGIIVNQRQPG